MKLHFLRLIVVVSISVSGFLWVSDYISQTTWWVFFFGAVALNVGLAMIQLRQMRAERRSQAEYQSEVDARTVGDDR